MRKSGKKIRITAQLIEVDTDTHLWSDTWDRDLDDVFEIQDEIAAKVVDELRVQLLGDQLAVDVHAPRLEELEQAAVLAHPGKPSTLERGPVPARQGDERAPAQQELLDRHLLVRLE